MRSNGLADMTVYRITLTAAKNFKCYDLVYRIYSWIESDQLMLEEQDYGWILEILGEDEKADIKKIWQIFTDAVIKNKTNEIFYTHCMALAKKHNAAEMAYKLYQLAKQEEVAHPQEAKMSIIAYGNLYESLANDIKYAPKIFPIFQEAFATKKADFSSFVTIFKFIGKHQYFDQLDQILELLKPLEKTFLADNIVNYNYLF